MVGAPLPKAHCTAPLPKPCPLTSITAPPFTLPLEGRTPSTLIASWYSKLVVGSIEPSSPMRSTTRSA